MKLGLGVSSLQTQFTSATSVYTPSMSASNLINSFQVGGTPTIVPISVLFLNQSTNYSALSNFSSNSSLVTEFNLVGKIGMGNSLSARISGFIGYSGGYSQAKLPVISVLADVSTDNGGTSGNPLPAGSSAVYLPESSSIATQNVTMKSGLGYGIMLGLGQDTTWGSFGVDVGVVFRSFGFYFPSAIPNASNFAQNANIAVAGPGFQPQNTVSDVNADYNTYQSYRLGCTRTGLRVGGDINFKMTEALSWGVSAFIEFFGNKNINVTPNVSSFNINATQVVASNNNNNNNNNNNTNNGNCSINANQIVNTNMLSNAVTYQSKLVQTGIMLNVTYSIPVGNE